jgi:hypothetical protein
MALVWYDPAQCDQLIPGFALGGLSCTCGAGVVSTDRNTFGKTILTIEAVRAATHDTSGGTTVQQVDDAIASKTGVDDLSTGYWGFDRIDHALQEGKGFLAAILYKEVHDYGLKQIAAGVKQADLITGQEHGFTGWHAETWHRWLLAGTTCVIHGKTLTAPPNQRGLIVFDPLCDGRRPTVAKGPVVYPESLVQKIVASSLIGGKLYGAITLDARYEVTVPTKPKLTLQYGGVAFRRSLVARRPGWKRWSPYRSKANPAANRVRYLAKGDRFEVFQKTSQGTLIAGSRVWYGNMGGDHWVHSSRFA